MRCGSPSRVGGVDPRRRISDPRVAESVRVAVSPTHQPRAAQLSAAPTRRRCRIDSHTAQQKATATAAVVSENATR